jgi:ribosomal-protein-alanine N-acetyltransferase
MVETNMIALRDYCDSDLDRLVGLANNKNVSRYLVYTFPYPYTRSDAEWWIATVSKQHGSISRAIEHQGRLVGGVGITLQQGWREHLGEIGYWVGEEYWGKGIATAALKRMTDCAFTVLQLRKLYAPVLAPNVASMRVLVKSGYTREAVLQAEVQKDGLFFDIHQFVRHHPQSASLG